MSSLRLSCLVIAVLAASCLLMPFCAHAQDMRELCRIRISNRADGAVEVSADGGNTYTIVGRVTTPATSVSAGFAASIYAQAGKVAATAVHGLRIRVGSIRQKDKDVTQLVSVIPKEFERIPDGFGGFVAGTSGIYTDIPAGTAIFRNLAPFVGNPVFLEKPRGLIPIPFNHSPAIGDSIVIVVEVPRRMPSEIIFENKVGGKVQAVYPDATETIAEVERPVTGVGRFDATGYTGIGCINTNHSGVITVSTAPLTDGAKDGSGRETRGGFQIEPSRHARTMGEAAQVLVVRPVDKNNGFLEGAAPLFSGFIGLSYDSGSEGNSYRVDMQCGDSEWRQFPPLVGKIHDALVSLPGDGRSVTSIRIRFPQYVDGWIEDQIRLSGDAYLRVRFPGQSPTRGILEISIDCSKLPSMQYVALYLDGRMRGISNSPPYAFKLNTEELRDGEHILQLRATDTSGSVVKTITRRFFVRKNTRSRSDRP